MRTIDADALIQTISVKCVFSNEISNMKCGELRKILEMIKDAPTVEPQRMRGRWERTVIGKARHIRCSSCKVGYYAQDVPHDLSGNVAWKYCPECGADMRGTE